ncbi:MAG: shikimate dehydrogenase [Thermoleophilia bacterium]|nr:shikimate dehydrogenase [Thermoleophilia bacterium]
MQAPGSGINAQTGLIGVIGHPVGHSLSPLIHNAAFRHDGLDMVYLAFDVPPNLLGSAVEGIRALDMRGANVTVPHKETVLHLMDEVDTLAGRVGAVNTIVNEQGQLVGYNTDVSGFVAAVHSVLPQGARGLSCLVVGAGGAARAVVAGLFEEEAQTIVVCNRTPARARSLCEAAAAWGATSCEAIDYDHIAEAATAAHLIVNATPVGLGGAVKDSPLPVDTIHGGQAVVDLAYGACETMLVEAARGRGAVAVDGKEMLIMQAASSYGLWTGLQPPIEVMRRSIEYGER